MSGFKSLHLIEPILKAIQAEGYTIPTPIQSQAIPKILELASKLDWVGRVAKIIGSKVYLNAGRESGINIGDILKIITEGTEIYDPETGARTSRQEYGRRSLQQRSPHRRSSAHPEK